MPLNLTFYERYEATIRTRLWPLMSSDFDAGFGGYSPTAILWIVIDDGENFIVGRNLEEIRAELVIVAEVHADNFRGCAFPPDRWQSFAHSA